MRKVYADHAATTRVHPEVAAAMMAFLGEEFGNPSSIHSFGRSARKHVENAREQVAALIGARAPEVFFTSGGTEADNWAIKGAAFANREKGKHLITTRVEHHAVLDVCEYLTKQFGYEVTYLPVDREGRVSVQAVAEAIRPDTVLCSVMLANNEVGTIMPVKEIAELCREKGVICHTDAVQALGQLQVDVKALGVDMMTISSHKIYGPKGIGALYVRRGFRFQAQSHGGGQERKMRCGTENVPGIIGFGKAAELARSEWSERAARARQLRDRFVEGVLQRVPGTILNGPPVTGDRLPNNANLSMEHVEGEAMLLQLDMKGVAASSGSACTSGSLEASHVLLAMGLPDQLAHNSLRFSFGRENSEEDIEYLLEVFPAVVERLRKMAPGVPLKTL